MPPVKIKSRYNYDLDVVSLTTGLHCPEPTLTQQQFQEEADINVLARRFKLTGELPQGVRMPTYADFNEVYDFHSAANAIAEANEAFELMPAETRRRFDNDPAKFVAFCSDDKNREEAQRLGLVPADVPLNTVPPVGGAPAQGSTPKETGTTAESPKTADTGNTGSAKGNT